MDDHGDIELVELGAETFASSETSVVRERTSSSVRTSDCQPSRYFSHVVASLPSQLAAKSEAGIKFSRKRISRQNYLLHRILVLLAEEEGRDNLEHTRGVKKRLGSVRKRMNRVSPEDNGHAPDEEPEEEDDLDNLDLGHHRVDLDNVETEEDRARTVELIRALPCRVGIKRRLL